MFMEHSWHLSKQPTVSAVRNKHGLQVSTIWEVKHESNLRIGKFQITISTLSSIQLYAPGVLQRVFGDVGMSWLLLKTKHTDGHMHHSEDL